MRIGGKEAKSEHSTLSWMAMLFAAGMGIGMQLVVIAFALLIFVMIVGFDVVSVSILDTMIAYVENFVGLSNPHGRDDTAWMHGWTVLLSIKSLIKSVS